MKALFVSNLFPNIHEPVRGVFNLHQMRHLAGLCDVKVVAPIAWFFGLGRFAPKESVPAVEEIQGLTVHHPKAFYLPKVGRTFNPFFYAASTSPLIERIHREWPFDVIFVNWAYPDACGIARVARAMGKPFVVSISGSDANWYLKFKIRRQQILTMIEQSFAVTVRSKALKDLLLEHGVSAEKVHVLYNGVDRQQFAPLSRDEARRSLQLPMDESILLYLGRLSPEKGVADLIDALALLRQEHKVAARLVAVGDGGQRSFLQSKSRELGLNGSVVWAGMKKPEEVARYISAADVLCLPSHMEGVPNAALEAFACGKPVVATRVGGIPEVVTRDTGVLTEPGNPTAFAKALSEAVCRSWDASQIRAHASKFDWDENARQLYALLQAATKR